MQRPARGLESLPVFLYGADDARTREEAAAAAGYLPSPLEVEPICEAVVARLNK
jgi:hypothetical protein